MACVMTSLSVIIWIIILPVLISCDDRWQKSQNKTRCFSDGKDTYCKGSDEYTECAISSSPNTTTRLFIEDCTLKKLSRDFFPKRIGLSLRSIQLKNVNFKWIADDSFTNIRNLIDLVLTNCNDINMTSFGNALGKIPGRGLLSIDLSGVRVRDDDLPTIFGTMNKSRIRRLTLGSNFIEKLRLDIFGDWISLLYLNLHDNIIDKIYPPMNHSLTLKALVLYGNRIGDQNLCEALDGNIPNLELLDLGYNGISDLETTNWACVPSLKTLNLAKNSIKFLNFSALQPLVSLRTLDMSNNWLANQTRDIFVPSLKKIDLSWNEFPTFPPWFCTKNSSKNNFPNLKFLDLSYNLFRRTIAEAWACLDKLIQLDISGNPVTGIQNNAFADLKSLRVLNVTSMHGRLAVLEPHAFNNTNLDTLNFQSNNIIFAKHTNLLDLFKHLKNLTALNLSYNRVAGLNETQITRLLSPLVNIKTLNLTEIEIYRLPRGLLGNFTHLTTLILAKNKFESRDLTHSFESAVKLTNLSLAKNVVRVVRQSSFSGNISKTLKRLDLSYNPLDCSCDNLWFRNRIDKTQGRTGELNLLHWPQRYQCRTPVAMSEVLFLDYHPTKAICEPLNPTVVAIISTASLLIIFLITVYMVYRCRWYIMFWRYKLFQKKNCEFKDPERRCLLKKAQRYDGYAIYNLKDEKVDEFVVKELSPVMNELRYRVFFWDRDAGNGAKVTEIIDGIYGAKKVVALVTNSFLKDTWCKFQVEVALDRQVELQEDFLLFIVSEEVDVKHLSKFWCVMFTKMPTVKWCTDTADIERKVLDARIKQHFGDPGPRNRHSQ